MCSLQLHHPSRLIISGCSEAGKTVLVFKLLDRVEWMYTVPPKRIIYCYSIYQPEFSKYEKAGVIFKEGLPSLDWFKTGDPPQLLIIDDLLTEIEKDKEKTVDKLFTKASHHFNLSVCLLVQNIYSKQLRTITLNATYFIFCRSPRDVGQFNKFCQQVYGQDYKFALDAYKDSTKKGYSYLFFDCHQTTDDALRIRTGIFAGDQTWCYVDKKSLYKDQDVLYLE